MDWTELLVPTGILVNLLALVLTFLFRKRIVRALGRLLLKESIEFVSDTYFDEVDVTDADGKKRVLRRPNANLERLVGIYGPLSAAWTMEWAKRNIKIKLPPFALPEGTDLKSVGMSAIATKVLAGKKLNLEDAIPMALGYVQDWAEKSGILEKILKPAPKAEVKPESENPFLKKLIQ